VNKSSAIFNFNEHDPRDWTDPKALWMNAEYLRAMPIEELTPLVRKQLEKAGIWQSEYAESEREWFARTVDLLRARYRTLADFGELGRPYFSEDFAFEPAAAAKNLKDVRLRELLPELARRLEVLGDFTHDSAEAALRLVAEEQGVKAGLLINAARTALTGQAVGPGMFDIMVTLGRERTVERLKRAVTLIGS
jgi:glutamyl-tRNA synthetase